MQTITRYLSVGVVCLLMLGAVTTLNAQRLLLGGGVAAGTIPRALEPLCASARRLNGVGLTARVGLDAGSFQAVASLDYVSRLGVRDAADCVARSGIWVDSAFASAGNSATSLGVSGSIPLNRVLRIGAEAGHVLKHSSWFIGPALGVQVSRIRLEVSARRHFTSYDQITRDYQLGNVLELSRESRTEGSWGAAARLLLLNH